MRVQFGAFILSLLVWALPGPAMAVRDIDPAGISVDRVVKLPIKQVSAVESNGEIMFISGDGRFVISGQLFDLWQRSSLDTIAQIEHAVSQVSLNSLGIDPATLNSVEMGEGPIPVTIYVDPLCRSCTSLLKEARVLGEEYTFHVVVVPALGEKSNVLAKKVSCANDKAELLDALIQKSLGALQVKPPCDNRRYQKTLVSAQMLGIDGVPFLIDANGQPHRGVPADLKAWLER